MWFTFLLIGCSGEGPPPTPKACRSFDSPPTCTLGGLVEGQPVEGQASLVAGVQGGLHVDLDASFAEVGSVVRFTASMVDEAGDDLAWDGEVDLVTDVADDCTASPYGVRAVFDQPIVGCGMDQQPVTITVRAERSDGEVATCSTEVVLQAGSSAWFCEEEL